jgi:hypothetical protein
MATPNHTFRRTRPEVRTRTVPHTVSGKTAMVTEEYTVHVPVPPRDWDRILLGGVTVATAAILAASVVWSTASVGALLALTVTEGIAYTVATIFDLAWIIFMAVEWLSRYNPRSAVLPRRAGHAALAIAMVAVFVHGITAGGRNGLAIGIIGSVISALAKTVWTVVMRHTAKRLDPRTQQWVDQQQAEAGARLALAGIHRQLARAEGQWADALAALPPADPDPDRPSGQPDTSDADTQSAVHAALATMPDATPEAIVEQLGQLGITTDTDTVRRLSGQPDSRSATLLRLADHRGSDNLSATVRLLVRDGITDPDTALTLARWVHGPDVKPETVSRLLSRFAV